MGTAHALSDEMKAERVRISRELLERFEKEGEDFVKIITGDETWVHHYDPENKRQSMEYHHKKSFPIHFLFKWRQNVSARPRIYIN